MRPRAPIARNRAHKTALLGFLITASLFNRPTWARLIALQFEQDFGVHTKARRKIYHRRRVIEPILAGFLASARLTSP